MTSLFGAPLPSGAVDISDRSEFWWLCLLFCFYKSIHTLAIQMQMFALAEWMYLAILFFFKVCVAFLRDGCR
jgi:hypothetical protein